MEHDAEEAAADVEHASEVLTDGVEHAADAAHGATGMPQLDPGIFPNLIFWLLVSLGLLYLILTRVALPRISAVLSERYDAIANDIEQAQILKQRAAEAEAAYDAKLARARDEAHQINADAKAKIDKELAALMAKADTEIAARAAESETRIAEIRESAAQSVEQVARDVAGDIVELFVPGAGDGEAVGAAVQARTRG